jgi:hypothetical protein
MQNHVVIIAIKKHLQKCTSHKITKVAAHTGIEGNELADTAAKEALIHGELIQLESSDFHRFDFFLHQNRQPVDVYPRRIIQRTFQNQIRGRLEDKFNHIWGLDDTDVVETVTIANKGMEIQNHLDSSHTKEQSFRIKLSFQKTPTLKLVQKYKSYINTICPRCGEEEEDIDHLFQCQDTYSHLDELTKQTTQLIESRKKDVVLYRPLKEQKDQPAGSYLLYYLAGKKRFDESFLDTPQSKGIITKSLIGQFKDAKRLQANRKLWLQLTVDSWLSTFYDVIWKRRCTQLDKATPKILQIRLNLPPPPTTTQIPQRITKIKLILPKSKATKKKKRKQRKQVRDTVTPPDKTLQADVEPDTSPYNPKGGTKTFKPILKPLTIRLPNRVLTSQDLAPDDSSGSLGRRKPRTRSADQDKAISQGRSNPSALDSRSDDLPQD